MRRVIEQVFNGFGCNGKNVSPALSWSSAPMDTKSFALLVHDPDAPAGDRPHRYNFTLHALKVDKLEVPKDAKASLVGFMVNATSIGKATLTGTYGRK